MARHGQASRVIVREFRLSALCHENRHRERILLFFFFFLFNKIIYNPLRWPLPVYNTTTTIAIIPSIKRSLANKSSTATEFDFPNDKCAKSDSAATIIRGAASRGEIRKIGRRLSSRTIGTRGRGARIYNTTAWSKSKKTKSGRRRLLSRSAACSRLSLFFFLYRDDNRRGIKPPPPPSSSSSSSSSWVSFLSIEASSRRATVVPGFCAAAESSVQSGSSRRQSAAVAALSAAGGERRSEEEQAWPSSAMAGCSYRRRETSRQPR